MKNTLLIFCSLVALTALSGCSNTFDGVGRDLQDTGDWFEETF